MKRKLRRGGSQEASSELKEKIPNIPELSKRMLKRYELRYEWSTDWTDLRGEQRQ
jgi:hypothetical protein